MHDPFRILIEAGAAVNPEGDWVHRAALHVAVQAGDPATVKLLLAAGARPEVKNYKQQTALDLAVEMGNPELVELLEEASRR